MTKTLWRPEVDGDGLFTRREALAYGWTDKDLRKCPDVYRVIHGVYAVSGTPLTHTLKCCAVARCSPPDTVITGRSAATLLGLDLARGSDQVEFLVSEHKYMNRRLGTRSWSVRTRPGEHEPWHRIRLATPERTAFDLLARNPVKAGVACVDAMLHSGLLRIDSLAYFLTGRHDHGIVKARKGFELLDGRAESPPESTLRLTLTFAGLKPEPQLEVHDEFGFVARVDLGFRNEKVAVEYDGAWHGELDQVRRDQQRRERLRANGWRVIVVTARELSDTPDLVVARVRSALLDR